MTQPDRRWRKYIYAITLAVDWGLAYWVTERFDERGESWRERDVLIARAGTLPGQTLDMRLACGDDFHARADEVLAQWDQLHRDVVAASWEHRS